MHVGIFIPYLHGGGAEFVARRWIWELHALGHNVTIYAYKREQPPVDLPKEVVVHQFKSPWPAMRHMLLPFWLHRRVGKDEPDVVLSMLTYSNVVALLTWAIFRHQTSALMVSERNMPSLENSNVGMRDRLTCWLARRLYRRAAGVLAISHPVAGDLISAFNVPATRLYVVPNPVISKLPAADPMPPVETSRSLHLAFVGRIVEQKRPELFLAVLSTMLGDGHNVRGTIIGDGPLRDQIEHESQRLGLNILFAGWHEPWWEAISDIDCVLLTARFEGLANVLVEAAAADIPSVACSRALGVADAIIPGVTGELAMTDHPSDYADAVLRACLRTPKSQDELQGWFEHFSTARSTASLLAAFRDISGEY